MPNWVKALDKSIAILSAVKQLLRYACATEFKYFHSLKKGLAQIPYTAMAS